MRGLVFRNKAGQSNYNTGSITKKDLSIESLQIQLTSNILMGVRDKNIGDSKFGLRPFSSVEAASIMETE